MHQPTAHRHTHSTSYVHRCPTIRCLHAEKRDLCISGFQAGMDDIERAAIRDESYDPECDRFVVPRLSPQQQAQIGDGALSLDALTLKYIRDRFEYRCVTVDNGRDALALER